MVRPPKWSRAAWLLLLLVQLACVWSATGQSTGSEPVPAPGASSNSTKFVLDGLLRLYGPGIQDRSPANLSALITRIAAPVLLQFDLILTSIEFAPIVKPTTSGLEDFASADGKFLFSIIDDLQADVSNLLSFSSANLLLKVLNGQLAGNGFNGTLLLLSVDYTNRAGAFPASGTPPDYQDLTTNVLVTGRDVGSFGADKQTLLLATIRERNLNVNAPIISINITDIQPQPQPRTIAGRRLLQSDSEVQTTAVRLQYIATPPTKQNLTLMWGQLLNEAFRNETGVLGLYLDVAYVNSTSTIEMPLGGSELPQCDPAPSDCGRGDGIAAGPTGRDTVTADVPGGPMVVRDSGRGQDGSGSDNKGAIIGGTVGGVLGALLVAAVVAALVVWRHRRQQRRRGKGDAPVAAAPGKRDDPGWASGQGSVDPSPATSELLKSMIGLHGTPRKVLDSAQDREGAAPDVTPSSGTAHTTESGLSGGGGGGGSSGGGGGGGGGGGTSTTRHASVDDVAAIPASEITLCLQSDGRPVCLGEGGFGTVFKGLRNGVQPVAVKHLRDSGDDVMLRALRREIRTLRLVSADANVVQFYGAVLDGEVPAMVLEYCEGGDLRHGLALDDHDEFRWDRRGWGIAMDIVRGLCHIHASNVIHRDLKSANILLTAEGRAKIADVGLAKLLGDENYLSSANTAGTFAYSAPELLLGQNCTQKADIYSVGVLLNELITRTTPVRGQLPDPVGRCPPAMVDLFWRCMEVPPDARPTATELYHALSDLDPAKLPWTPSDPTGEQTGTPSDAPYS